MGDRRRSGGYAESQQQVRDVTLDGVLAQGQSLCDLAIAQPLGDESQDLDLTLGQCLAPGSTAIIECREQSFRPLHVGPRLESVKGFECRAGLQPGSVPSPTLLEQLCQIETG